MSHYAEGNRAKPGRGPLPCIRDGELSPNGRAACGEDVALRGTSTYCATCGQWTGVTTVSFPDNYEEIAAAEREGDVGTVLEYIHGERS